MRSYYDIQERAEIRGLYVDGEYFDWAIDPDSIAQAKTIVNKDAFMGKGVEGMIQQHFITCFGELVGWPVTLAEVVEAIKTGWIEKKEVVQ